jgi:hypothetical protein
MPRAKTNRLTENKPDRVPVSGLRDILTVYGKDDRFKYRFVEDSDERGMRIMRFQRGGWTFTEAGEESDIIVGEECVYKSRQGESIIRYATGHARYSYLMQIPKELWTEDQKAKQDAITETEKTMTRRKHEDDNELGQYGKLKITHNKK